MKSRAASWIWSSEGVEALRPDDHRAPFRVRLFRRTFEVASTPTTEPIVHVSADTWYQLYCNGRLLGEGPAKGDVHHHFYDTYRIGSYLTKGTNVIAARVVDTSPVRSNPPTLGAQTSFLSYSGGFMLQSSLPIDTDERWRVAVERAYSFQNQQLTHGGFIGYFEELDARRVFDRWTGLDFVEDAETWEAARCLYPAITYADRRDDETPYGLLPRSIPQLAPAAPRPFERVFQIEGDADEAAWRSVALGAVAAGGSMAPDGTGGAVRVPPHSRASAVVDVGELTTGFPHLRTAGGAGAAIRMTYAEALRLEWDTKGATMLGRKVSHEKLAWGYTDENRGWTHDPRGSVEGFCDIYHPPDGIYDYRPLRFRTFRFIKIEIETDASPLELSTCAHSFLAYPFEVAAHFESGDSLLDSYWETSIRTYRLCCHETFEDCPYYEQMQYAGDSAITSQIALWTSGDSRLSAQAIRHFDWSRIPDGITQSRYPSSIRQFIPSWSLHWIMMIADYYELTGDLRLVREVLPGVRCVLDWFRAHSDASGLPTKLPYWNNVDWCPEWDRGQPPGWDSGATAVISCQLIVALETYRALVAATGGSTDRRAAINAEITEIRRAAQASFWNPTLRIVQDASTVESTSQYSAAWALLAEIVPEDATGALADTLSAQDGLAPASFFGLYYVVEALCRLGRYRDALRIYDRWREMAEFGLSTWAEETTYWRSLCHAWSAHPALFLLKRVLGASPAGPGFDGLIVAPKPCGLPRASGAFATPLGQVAVEWSIRSGEIEIAVRAPEDLAVEIVAPKTHDGTDVHGPVSGRRSVRAVAPFDDTETTRR